MYAPISRSRNAFRTRSRSGGGYSIVNYSIVNYRRAKKLEFTSLLSDLLDKNYKNKWTKQCIRKVYRILVDYVYVFPRRGNSMLNCDIKN